VHKRDLHQIHLLAWKRGVKSLYYLRSKSIQRAESGAGEMAARAPAPAPALMGVPVLGKINERDRPLAGVAAKSGNDYEECLACQ